MSKNNSKTAFSLIELSIAVLIIGIIVGGALIGSKLIDKARLASARMQTANSPVMSIADLVLWLETTSPLSFQKHPLKHKTAITTWLGLNPASEIRRNAIQNTVASKPYYYTNCINGLPCLKFNDTNAAMPNTTYTDNMEVAPPPPIINSSYTIFIVEQRQTANAKYFLGGVSSDYAVGNNRLLVGYQSDTTIRVGHGSASDNNYYIATDIIPAFSQAKPRIHTFYNGYGYNGSSVGFHQGTKTYFANDSEALTSNLSSPSPRLTTQGSPGYANIANVWTSLLIGRTPLGGTQHYYVGDVGEIIIYSRALTAEERNAVLKYLMKKWKIKENDV